MAPEQAYMAVRQQFMVDRNLSDTEHCRAILNLPHIKCDAMACKKRNSYHALMHDNVKPF
jgi:hypothetical protein